MVRFEVFPKSNTYSVQTLTGILKRQVTDLMDDQRKVCTAVSSTYVDNLSACGIVQIRLDDEWKEQGKKLVSSFCETSMKSKGLQVETPK